MVTGQIDCETEKLGREQLYLKSKGHTLAITVTDSIRKGEVLKGRTDSRQEPTNTSSGEASFPFEFIYGGNSLIGEKPV